MSTNISKKKRDDLLDKIKQIRAFIAAAPQDENTGNLLSYLSELEKDVNGKKYGLVFEEHREEIDEVLDTHTPVLTEDADLFIDHGVQMNFLIEGDNLASLQLLEKTHKGKIDLIYIDPPYNTGAKDFVYDDAFVDTTDGFNHSKWLSFMKQRLSLSKKLLAAHGTIFISIDDNEFSQLKLLCDEVFGANNYVGTILWKKKTNGNNMGWLPPVHDYILCYSKEIGKIYDFGFEVSEEDILKNYSNPDNDPRGPWTTTDLSANHKGPYFPVTNPKTGDVYYPPAGRYWVFNEQEIQRRIADGRIIFGKSGMARPVQRVFAKDRKFSKRKVESWWDNHGMNADATQELKDIFGVAKVFTHPKPTQLIKDIVKMSCSKTATILDFFAGSGTTGHAVMNLNAEDGGTRRFILCTNNENGICRDVTYERIRRVIDKEDYAASLKYYKVTDSNLNHTGIYLYSKGKIMIHLTFDYKTDEKCTTPGQYLKYHRTFQGLSTRELAEKVGIVPATLVLYENDRHPIKYSTAVALANVLGIDRNRLLDEYTAFVDYPYFSLLKKVRQDLSLTQIQMAELIGIGQTSYSGWEREIRVPRRKEYDKILAALKKLRVNVDTYLCQSASI